MRTELAMVSCGTTTCINVGTNKEPPTSYQPYLGTLMSNLQMVIEAAIFPATIKPPPVVTIPRPTTPVTIPTLIRVSAAIITAPSMKETPLTAAVVGIPSSHSVVPILEIFWEVLNTGCAYRESDLSFCRCSIPSLFFLLYQKKPYYFR